MEYQHPRRQMPTLGRKADSGAQMLGWFSIGLGVAELLMARSIARSLGMKRREGLVRAYGMREIANGIGLLTSRDRAPWMWGRVAGDALDLATLGNNVDRGNRKTRNVALALGAVAGITALDVACARELSTQKRQPERYLRDYSDRSGFPRPPEAMRGLAAKDFKTPRDMRTLEPMRAQPTAVPPTAGAR